MIHYVNEVRRSGIDRRALVATAQRLLEGIGESGASLSLRLVSDKTMRAINREYRGKDRATDVLSFPLDGQHHAVAGSNAPERLLGDVVISVETARVQAAEYDASLDREVHRLLIHGLLHVVGYDHELPAQRRSMVLQERRLAELIGLPWPYETQY